MPFSVSSSEGFSSTVPGLSYPKMVEQIDPDKPASPKDGTEAESKTPKERGKKASKACCHTMSALPRFFGNLIAMCVVTGTVVLYLGTCTTGTHRWDFFLQFRDDMHSRG